MEDTITCPICGQQERPTGWTTDARIILTCRDAVSPEQVPDACPECGEGVIASVGRVERETGHQPYACDHCSFSG